MGTERNELRQLQALTGRRLGPYNSFNPVNRAQIWQWCTAMGDDNPLYLDDEYRRGTEFSRVVAPPAMMQMWTMRDFNDHYAPGSTTASPYPVIDRLSALGYPGNVAVSYDLTFYRYLTEGERPHHYTTVVDISGRKRTALGEGYFFTERVEYLTEGEVAFAQALITYFQYKPAQITASHGEDRKREAHPKSPDVSTEPPTAGWQPDFSDLDVDSLEPGQLLPELVIPISHRLVIGGAIATQDYVSVHHSVPAAQAAAMPDIFMNILTTNGLSARYLTDWAGAGSRLKAMQFRLLAPNHPGDVMVMRGTIGTIQPAGDRTVVSVAFSGSNRLGTHVQGTAVLSLPAHTN